tara:strand:- start:9 stop:125 length:117 start_codon:yes stop_codon:yes gene_type:complete
MKAKMDPVSIMSLMMTDLGHQFNTKDTGLSRLGQKPDM